MELGLRHLRIVQAVHRSGSISSAAAALGMSQPSLSAQLTRIEATLGSPLFHRTRSGVRPTPAGEVVLQRSTRILAEFDGLVRDAHAHAHTGRTLVVSANRTPDCSSLFAALIPRLSQRDLVPHLSTSSTVIEGLMATGDVDVALVGIHPRVKSRPVPDHIEEMDVVVAERHLVALSAEHPLARLREVPLELLGQDPWLLPPGEPDGTVADMRRAFAAAGIDPPTPHGQQRLSEYGPYVAAGLAVGAALPSYVPYDGVVVRPIAGMPLVSKRVLRWNTASVSRSEAEVCARTARDCFTEQLERTAQRQAWWDESPEHRPTLAELPDGALSEVAPPPGPRADPESI